MDSLSLAESRNLRVAARAREGMYDGFDAEGYSLFTARSPHTQAVVPHAHCGAMKADQLAEAMVAEWLAQQLLVEAGPAGLRGCLEKLRVSPVTGVTAGKVMSLLEHMVADNIDPESLILHAVNLRVGALSMPRDEVVPVADFLSYDSEVAQRAVKEDTHRHRATKRETERRVRGGHKAPRALRQRSQLAQSTLMRSGDIEENPGPVDAVRVPLSLGTSVSPVAKAVIEAELVRSGVELNPGPEHGVRNIRSAPENAVGGAQAPGSRKVVVPDPLDVKVRFTARGECVRREVPAQFLSQLAVKVTSKEGKECWVCTHANCGCEYYHIRPDFWYHGNKVVPLDSAVIAVLGMGNLLQEMPIVPSLVVVAPPNSTVSPPTSQVEDNKPEPADDIVSYEPAVLENAMPVAPEPDPVPQPVAADVGPRPSTPVKIDPEFDSRWVDKRTTNLTQVLAARRVRGGDLTTMASHEEVFVASLGEATWVDDPSFLGGYTKINTMEWTPVFVPATRKGHRFLTRVEPSPGAPLVGFSMVRGVGTIEFEKTFLGLKTVICHTALDSRQKEYCHIVCPKIDMRDETVNLSKIGKTEDGKLLKYHDAVARLEFLVAAQLPWLCIPYILLLVAAGIWDRSAWVLLDLLVLYTSLRLRKHFLLVAHVPLLFLAPVSTLAVLCGATLLLQRRYFDVRYCPEMLAQVAVKNAACDRATFLLNMKGHMASSGTYSIAPVDKLEYIEGIHTLFIWAPLDMRKVRWSLNGLGSAFATCGANRGQLVNAPIDSFLGAESISKVAAYLMDVFPHFLIWSCVMVGDIQEWISKLVGKLTCACHEPRWLAHFRRFVAEVWLHSTQTATIQILYVMAFLAASPAPFPSPMRLCSRCRRPLSTGGAPRTWSRSRTYLILLAGSLILLTLLFVRRISKRSAPASTPFLE